MLLIIPKIINLLVDQLDVDNYHNDKLYRYQRLPKDSIDLFEGW